jgi:hypothetical protein
MRRFTLWLRPAAPALLLFVLALCLRLVGLGWGLPCAAHWYPYHPDERDIAIAVFQLDFLGGQFNPHFYNYPSLYLYLSYFVHGVMGLCGKTHLFTAQTSEIWPEMRELIVAGRLVSAVLGAATVPLVYCTGKSCQKLLPKAVGLPTLAALLLCFAPAHLQHSHFATVDISATFFCTAAVWAATWALCASSPQRRRQLLYLGGLCAGLAAATKYNAVIAIMAPLTAALCLGHTQPQPGAGSVSKSMAAICLCGLVGFVAGCPGALFAFAEFWGNPATGSGLSFELLRHPSLGSGDIFKATGNGWWYHLAVNLPFAMTTPLLLSAAFGFGALLARSLKQRIFAALPLCAFAGFFFLSLGMSQVRFMRYTLPLLPLLCLTAAAALTAPFQLGAPQNWCRRLLRCSLAGVVSAVVVWAGFGVLRPLAATDPRDEAAHWMSAQQAIRPGRISIGLPTAPWFYTPPFVPRDAAPPAPTGASLQALLDANPRYRLVVTGFSADNLRHDKPDFVVLSEFEFRDQLRLGNAGFAAFAAQLAKSYRLVQLWGRQDVLGSQFAGFSIDPAPHDYIYANPQIRLYRRREKEAINPVLK